MIHEVPIKWHDLIEDPNDLPKKDGMYVISVKSEKYGALTQLRWFFASEKEWDNMDNTFCDPWMLDVIAWTEQIRPYRRNDNA